ncbi:hypothetical protein EC991_001511 [Linnemannia zychae]|nr:hypothetical protein EC991_001511 [Linnemannia zychae]
MKFSTVSAISALFFIALVQAAPAENPHCSGSGDLTLARGANLVCNNCIVTNVSGRTLTSSGSERLQALKECALKPLSTGDCYYFNGQLYCPHPCSRC